ncbi:4-coumarate--CoA ligase-like 9 [Camellia lanceoleosa]|uniref:4-coumarate--CoA ligase-like 9 n=1 Tax=Camellia lanceoleosa TaxID=1840588 RepID=A0ACC0I5G1_9ERIC|nr:4-coumarate--CoA ligase-like 9 [Camellia lanceoleosa]
MENSNKSIDPNSGFCSQTKIFHSLRPTVVLPPQTTPLSAASFALSLQLSCPWRDPTALINSNTGQRISYSDFIQKTKTLAVSLQTLTGLSKGDTAFILSPTSILIPIIYFSLLSIGIVVSPANPSSTDSEIAREIKLSKPVIAFATSTTCSKLPNLRFGTILIDSLKFESMMTSSTRELSRVEVSQSDIAAIMYSSGTTGEVKGVMLTHRNLIAAVASYYVQRVEERDSAPVLLYTMPFFHVYGFFYSLKSVAVSETVVVMERFDLKKMIRAVEEFRVTNAAAAPPVVVAMAKEDVAEGYDLRSLEGVGCGGSPLAKEVIAAFKAKFPFVRLLQGYGLTESTGIAFRVVTPEECERWGSVGRLLGNCQAKIVDPHTGIALPPCNQGELWIKGPMVMKGYVGNKEATSATLLAGGWLRTGDLCYIDNEGFLFIVDRLKELIKYKGYQVPPAELEQLLQSHPEIVDAAVVPYPDEEVGEVPMAFVVRHPQSNLNEAQVMDFVAKQVAPYKKIRRVAFVNSIPKSPVGKILREELRKIAVPRTFSKL